MSTNKEPLIEKCDSERMCTWLADRVESLNHRGKGFVPVYVLSKDENRRQALESILYGVKYQQARGDNGTLINHCPFCGGSPGRRSINEPGRKASKQ